jgi:hypothetical protein
LTITYEQVLEAAQHLTLRERLRLVKQIVGGLEDMTTETAPRQPLNALDGALAEMNVRVSPEDIAEAREAMMKISRVRINPNFRKVLPSVPHHLLQAYFQHE